MPTLRGFSATPIRKYGAVKDYGDNHCIWEKFLIIKLLLKTFHLMGKSNLLIKRNFNLIKHIFINYKNVFYIFK